MFPSMMDCKLQQLLLAVLTVSLLLELLHLHRSHVSITSLSFILAERRDAPLAKQLPLQPEPYMPILSPCGVKDVPHLVKWGDTAGQHHSVEGLRFWVGGSWVDSLLLQEKLEGQQGDQEPVCLVTSVYKRAPCFERHCIFPLYARRNTSDVHSLIEDMEGPSETHRYPVTAAAVLAAGAHAGYSTVYLAMRYRAAKVVAMEADPDNLALLKLNTEHLQNVVVMKAVLGEEGSGGKGMGKPPGPSFTLQKLQEVTGASRLDILEIDVHGLTTDMLQPGGDKALLLSQAQLVIAKVYGQEEGAVLESIQRLRSGSGINDTIVLRCQAPATSPTRMLKFNICNGLVNQRLALIYGLLLAKELDRAAVLPPFLLDGEQGQDSYIVPGERNPTVDFGQVYDFPQLRDAVRSTLGVELIPPNQATALLGAASSVSVSLDDPVEGELLEHLRSGQRGEAVQLVVGCPLFRVLDRHAMAKWRKVVMELLQGLQPAPEYRSKIEAAKVALGRQAQTGGKEKPTVWKFRRTRAEEQHEEEKEGEEEDEGEEVDEREEADVGAPRYTFLHLRLEDDWWAHCLRWSSPADGRDNCWNNTETVDKVLGLQRVPTSVPLYVASGWSRADEMLAARVLRRLRAAGYHVVLQKDVFLDVSSLEREQLALLDFYLALDSERFIGNSVSTFTALAILERRAMGRWASQYNGGGIPLEGLLPYYKLPWVVTFNSWSEEYEYLLKAAVRSGVKTGTLNPYCVFSGERSAPIAVWLEGQGVTIVEHKPDWADKLAAKLDGGNRMFSHLFASPGAAIGTCQRLDIPILPSMDQYEYVLYTDADIFFKRGVSLSDFVQPLPPVVGMAAEVDDMFPYNAGVMLMHVPRLRETYKEFIAFFLSNDKGMQFKQGPLDQGALNEFYEADIRPYKLPQRFNAKPYHRAVKDAIVVHFHGPKPLDYYNELTHRRQCSFDHLCRQGTRRSYCRYVRDWRKFYRDGECLDPEFRPLCGRELKGAG